MRAEIGLVSIMAAAGVVQKKRSIAGAGGIVNASASRGDALAPPASGRWTEATAGLVQSACRCRISRRSRSRPFQSSMPSWNAARSRCGGGDPA